MIDFADAVRLVEMRGKLCRAVPEGTGAMAAIMGLDDASIAKRVKKLQKVRSFLR